MQETQVRSLGWEDPLEKEMATHSSILAWRIPWTEEPGGLQSMGSQMVGHDWSDLAHTRRGQKGRHGGCRRCDWIAGTRFGMAEIVYLSGWRWETWWKLGVLLSHSSVHSLEGPTCEPRQKERGGNPQWLSHLASTAGGPGLMPGQKTKFLHARRGGWRKQWQNKLFKKKKKQ